MLPLLKRTFRRYTLRILLHFLCIITTVPPPNYRPLLKRTQLAFTAWVESLNIRDYGREKHTDPVKVVSLYHYLAFFFPLVAVW